LLAERSRKNGFKNREKKGPLKAKKKKISRKRKPKLIKNIRWQKMSKCRRDSKGDINSKKPKYLPFFFF
jgi:hypothetical protein